MHTLRRGDLWSSASTVALSYHPKLGNHVEMRSGRSRPHREIPNCVGRSPTICPRWLSKRRNGVQAKGFDPVESLRTSGLARLLNLLSGEKEWGTLLVDDAKLDDDALDVVA